MASYDNRIWRPVFTAFLGITLMLSTSACEAGDEDDDTGGSEGDDDPPPPPQEGLRVFPKYMLQAVPAVVTMEPGGQPVLCPPDAAVGGYLCDIDGIYTDSVLLRVERDGFETALREPAIVQNSIETIDVHLSPEGGPTGTWSECAAVEAFSTCSQVCADEGKTCAPTACETGDGSWPIATMDAFASVGCAGNSVESAATSCGTALPVGGSGVESVRCCCSD